MESYKKYANLIIKESLNINQANTLDVVRLNKILFVSYVIYARQTNKALFKENFVPSLLGPVLEDSNKSYSLVAFATTAKADIEKFNDAEIKAIKSAIDYTKNMSTISLIKYSSFNNCDWKLTWSDSADDYVSGNKIINKHRVIPFELINKYYKDYNNFAQLLGQETYESTFEY